MKVHSLPLPCLLRNFPVARISLSACLDVYLKGNADFCAHLGKSYGVSGSKDYKVGKIGCKIRPQCLTGEGNFGLVLIIRSIEKLGFQK